MSAITQKKLKIPLTFYALGLIALVGLVLAIIRMVQGLGATTNLNDGYPWGLWIAFDFFAVPLSAGAFTLAAVLHIFNREKYHAVAHLALLAGFLGYLMVILVLVLDIGRWDQFYSVLLPWRWNIHSFMFEVALSITLYFGVMAIELVNHFFGRKDWRVVRWIRNLIPLIAGVGVLLSTVHQSSIGAIFLVLQPKLDALWWSPIIPLHFFTSAVFSGLCVAIGLAILTWKAMRRPAPLSLLSGLAKVAAWVMALYLALKFGDLLFAGEFGLMFSNGLYSLLFWMEIILVVVPMALFFSGAGNKETRLLAGSVCALVALAINRSVVAWFALAPTPGYSYTPHWIELVITAAAFAAGILFYSLGVRNLPELKEGVLHDTH